MNHCEFAEEHAENRHHPARAAEGVGPYDCCGMDSPESGYKISLFCRVVEDADPYVIETGALL